jgi:hypothetical protein
MKEKWKDKDYRENQIAAQNEGKADPEYRERMSIKMTGKFADEKNWMYGRKDELHPLFGTKHSPETIEKMRQKRKEKWANDPAYRERMTGENNPMFGVRGEDAPGYGKPTPHSKGRWFPLPDGKPIWIRSSYEERALTVILATGVMWIYEPKAFPITVDGKKTTYRPDFYFPEYNMWWDTKGTKRNGDWVYPKSRKKVEAFLTQYPEENLKILYESDIDQLELAFTHGETIDLTKFGQHLSL